MNKKLWDFFGDNFVSIATVIGGVAVLVLSMIGIIDDKILLQAVLGLLVLVATSGIVERHKRLDAIYELTSQIVKSDDFKVFDHNIDEYYRFLADRVAKANKTIDVINFRYSLPRNVPGRQFYKRTIENIMSKGRIRIRRVVIFYDTETVGWIEDLLKRFNGQNLWVAYCEKPPKYIPALNMMIIDGKEVFVGGFYHEDLFEERGSTWLNNKQIAEAFLAYYDYLFVNTAKPLNPKEEIQEKLIEKIRKELLYD